MECKKCQIELEEDSRFCPKCGEKIENRVIDLDKLYSKASGRWFLLGMMHGILKERKDEKGIKEIEHHLAKYGCYEEYLKALTFAKNQLSQSKQNHGENKEIRANAH